jgi:hypothetical protein
MTDTRAGAIPPFVLGRGRLAFGRPPTDASFFASTIQLAGICKGKWSMPPAAG